jgi:hypothetical protein
MAIHAPRFSFTAFFRGVTSLRVRRTMKALALHPYMRLFVLLSTFIALFSAVIIKDDQLPTLRSDEGDPQGERAWRDLAVLTRRPHPFNTRQNDVVREFILAEMREGRWTLGRRLM